MAFRTHLCFRQLAEELLQLYICGESGSDGLDAVLRLMIKFSVFCLLRRKLTLGLGLSNSNIAIWSIVVYMCCWIHLYSPITRKQRWRYILNESAPAYELSISEFSGWFVDFLPLNLLLVRRQQIKIIIVKRLIQRRNNVSDEGGSWT